MKKSISIVLSLLLAFSMFGNNTAMVQADELDTEPVQTKVDTTGYTVIGNITNYSVDGSYVNLSLSDGNKIRVSFLDTNIFRYYVNIGDEDFLEYPKPRSTSHTATIVAQSDATTILKNGVIPNVSESGNTIIISTSDITLEIDKTTSMMVVKRSDGTVVMEEAAPLMFNGNKTVQSLSEKADEYFYGGGTQNGRFSHKGNTIRVANTNNWVDGGVASPNPYYWSTKGYGVVRNTFAEGLYNFGSTEEGIVQTTHNESRFDAYYIIGSNPTELLNGYTDLTGKPSELPDYSFYLSHLNCYNRDAWKEVPAGTDKAKKIGDTYYLERNGGGTTQAGEMLESLLTKNGNYEVTAQKIIDLHEEHDLPLGWFLPNDGYGCGYGQTDSFDGDIQELKAFTEFANSKGVEVGLWTQSNLWPADINNPQKGERDVKKEVEVAGVRAIKTDVAWVGAGYSMALDGVSKAYEAITELSNSKAAIVSLDGWAGTQRFAGIWSGDQTGGNWEYIRFHIPTYITTGLSGQPYVGSDMDGIFGGQNEVIQTRDFQWKAFTPYMLDMDGWGSSQKNPWEFGEDTTSINRAYLKLKAQMMPYISTTSHYAAETGVPMVRAMMLEEQNSYTLGESTKYQYMWGDNILVAPIYKNTNADSDGNDIRNDIYLPETADVWVDYFTGEQYRGGTILNNFDAPVWKTPVFVKNGTILPLYSENNNPNPVTATNPKGLDKTMRRAEVFPSGSTSFNVYEDDGITINGGSINTLYESDVTGDVATFKINPATGSYSGVVSDRNHEVIMNVSKKPTSVDGNVNGNPVTFTEVTSLEDYETATGNVYFYNENPLSIVSQYATEGSNYDVNPITVRPKVYIKSTETVNIFSTEFEVKVHGFENTAELDKDELNPALQTPTNVSEGEITAESIELTWDSVADATSYDVEVDGYIVSNIKDTSYTHAGLSYSTDHAYRVRAHNALGYSEWTPVLSVTTLENPYRNVPVSITATWSGGSAYSGTPADAVDLDFATQFHSQANANTSYFTMDMNKVYEMDKLEYVPRQDNFGNGTLRQFEVEYSLDGVHWNSAYIVGNGGNETTWSWPSSAPVDGSIVSKTIDFPEVFSARYLRIRTIQSVGNFFTAFEIIPYAVDGSNPKVSGDYANANEVGEGTVTFFDNYSGLRKGLDNDFDYVSMADVNFDGYINAYDINFSTRLMDGGASVSDNQTTGKILVSPDKTSAQAGDVVTYTVYGINMSDVNGFSAEIPLDNTIHENVENNPTAISEDMHNFSYVRTHGDGSLANHVSYVNIGEQVKLSGTQEIATFSIKYKQAVSDTSLVLTDAIFVGSNLSYQDGLQGEVPSLPETQKVLGLSDFNSVTFTNSVLTSDDGSNAGVLFQPNYSYENLFDGNLATVAEFKWFFNSSSFGPEVTLPTTIHVDLKESEPVKTVKVYNRSSKSNGYVTSMSAKAYDGATEYDLGTIVGEYDIFEFPLPANVMIDRVDITPLTSRGTTSFDDQPNTNRMLTLREIEIITDSEVAVTDVNIQANDVYVGTLTKIEAGIVPTNASNPFVTITGSDDSVAEIIQIATEDGYDYYIKAKQAGELTLTVVSQADVTITKDITINVIEGVDVSELNALIAKAQEIQTHLYTDTSVSEFEGVLAQAVAVAQNPTSASEVTTIKIQLTKAMNKLVFKGSDTSRPDSTNLIDSDTLTAVSCTSESDGNVCANVIDKDINTLWHSGYQSYHTLPVDVVIDLNDNYNLEQINLMARQASRNGDITHYRIETSLDGVTYSPVVEGYLENDGYSLTNRSDYKTIKFEPVLARYVKVIAIETLGNVNNHYASIAELQFFGILEDNGTDEDIFITDMNFEETSIIIEKDLTATPVLVVNPSDHTETIIWSSDNESVATVENGTITAISEGNTIITATSANTSASINVTVKGLDTTSLETIKDLVNTYLNGSEDIHTAIKTPIVDALSKVQEILDDPSSYTQQQIEEAYANLLAAYNNRSFNVDFVTLQNHIDLDLSVYDTSTTATYKELVELAKAYLLDVTDLNDVVAHNDALALEKQNLVLLDRTDLEMLIENASAINQDNLVEASQTALADAIATAQNVLSNATTNQALEEAYDELYDVVVGLTYKADEAAINNLKDRIEVLENLNLNNYTKEDQKRINDLLDDAKTKLESGNLSQSEIADLIAQLDELISSLTTYIDKPFNGLPSVVRVGDTFTLYPDSDDQVGAAGWEYDNTLLVGTFNSPATFTALKEGEVTIKYTDSKGNVQTTTFTIEKAKDTNNGNNGNGNNNNNNNKPATGTDTPGGNNSNHNGLPSTGQSDNNYVVIIGAACVVIGLIAFTIRKRKQSK